MLRIKIFNLNKIVIAQDPFYHVADLDLFCKLCYQLIFHKTFFQNFFFLRHFFLEA